MFRGGTLIAVCAQPALPPPPPLSLLRVTLANVVKSRSAQQYLLQITSFLSFGQTQFETKTCTLLCRSHQLKLSAPNLIFNNINLNWVNLFRLFSVKKCWTKISPGIRGCPHITSANFGGFQTPPPPLVSLSQHWADPPSINAFKENTLFDMKQ